MRFEKACAAGLRIVQIREKDLPEGELYDLCERFREIGTRHGTKIIVNGRADMAVKLDLDGVHLTEESMSPLESRAIVGPDKWIGVSVHSAEGLKKAEQGSADFAVLGPVAPTMSKSAGHRIMTAEEFSAACAAVTIPVFALGGIDLENADFWIRQGAQGIAGISVWIEAPDIAERLKQLEKRLGHL